MPLLRVPDFVRQMVGLPERGRLMNFITDAWADFDREVESANGTAVTEPWARSAYLLLLRAETHVTNRDIEQGWATALSAQRAILSKPNNRQRLERMALVLKHEAESKITGWRAKAIQDLICDSNGKLILLEKDDNLMRVIDAVALRDDFLQNNWFKILLRRRHLLSLSMILWSAILLVLVFSWTRILPEFLWDTKVLSTAVLFGVLGAVVSLAQSLTVKDISDRIPVQQLGAIDVWMRPGIGAAASLVVLILLNANDHFKIFAESVKNPEVIVVLSLVAGYSERFIIGALDTISSNQTSESKQPKTTGTRTPGGLRDRQAGEA
jgi:hypothetical protein